MPLNPTHPLRLQHAGAPNRPAPPAALRNARQVC